MMRLRLARQSSTRMPATTAGEGKSAGGTLCRSLQFSTWRSRSEHKRRRIAAKVLTVPALLRAMSVIMIIPVLLLVLKFQRLIVAGLTRGTLKG
ncbi:hypothetical protein BH23CHL4_BH23CHL4_24390 [soil metagenome]